MDSNSVLIPYLDFAFISDDGAKEFSLIHQENSYHSKMPSWVTSFSYNRKATSMGAGSWSLALSDPTFTLLDILNSIFSGQEITEDDVVNANSGFMNSRFSTTGEIVDPFGRVRFSYGWRGADGTQFAIVQNREGWIQKISPSIVSKHKLVVNMIGVDRNPLDRITSVSLVGADLFVNTTLGDSLNLFLSSYTDRESISLGEDSSGEELHILRPQYTQYEIQYKGDTLSKISVNDAEIANGNMSSLGQNITAGNFTFTLENYLKHLELLLSEHHIKFIINPTRVLKGNGGGLDLPDAKTSKVVIYVKQMGELQEDTPTYYVNTTSTDFIITESGIQTKMNDSRVISFDPTIEPLVPVMLGAATLQTDTYNEDTLENEKIRVDVTDNESAVTDGGMLTTTVMNIPLYTEGTMYSRNMVQQKMAYLQGWLARIPFRASMRCQYINTLVDPFDYINVFVGTPQGQAFFTSGHYMITDVADSVTPGRLITTYQMIKSGSQKLSNLVPNYGRLVNDNDSQ